jgi:hypothetical protein
LSQAEGAGTPLSNSLDPHAQVFGTRIEENSQTSSPHTTLTALCQLTAIRLAVQRAGISLIARQAQYILAESTQTLNLRDTTKSEEAGDGLWMGLTQVSPGIMSPREGAELVDSATAVATSARTLFACPQLVMPMFRLASRCPTCVTIIDSAMLHMWWDLHT